MNRDEVEKRRKILLELGFVCSDNPLPGPQTHESATPGPDQQLPKTTKTRAVKTFSAEKPKPSSNRPTAPAGQKNMTDSRPVPDFPDLSKQDREKRLAKIAVKAAKCELCRLHLGRTNSVPGEGDPMAELMFIGEGPGQNEDKQGRPFVGRSGQLLEKIIIAMKFTRESVYIGNIVKCRPPENRKPHADEMQTCFPFIDEQMEVLKPKVIVTLGVTSLTGLLPEFTKTPIGKIRGQWQTYRGVKVMPTLHPAYLLRQPAQKKFVWEDMQKVMAEFGLKP